MIKRLLSRADAIIALWALFLLVLWVPSWAIWHPDSEVVILLAIAIGATLAKAVAATARDRVVPEPGDRHPSAVVDTTHATSLVGIAFFCAVLGLEFGPWLLYIAGGLLLVGLAGLIREHRAARQALRSGEEVEPR